MKFLLDRGADVHARDQSGRTPFVWAASHQSFTVIGGGELLEYLTQRGADPNAVDNSGMSRLAYAELQIRNGDLVFIKIAEVLRNLGAIE